MEKRKRTKERPPERSGKKLPLSFQTFPKKTVRTNEQTKEKRKQERESRNCARRPVDITIEPYSALSNAELYFHKQNNSRNTGTVECLQVN